MFLRQEVAGRREAWLKISRGNGIESGESLAVCGFTGTGRGLLFLSTVSWRGRTK